jgi:hypothetical protein
VRQTAAATVIASRAKFSKSDLNMLWDILQLNNQDLDDKVRYILPNLKADLMFSFR